MSGWWDMREWWWKIGFTSHKIRHWSPSWQHSSSGAISSGYWAWLLPAGAPMLNPHFKSTPIGGLRWPPLRNYLPMYRIQCSTQETHSTRQHIPHWAPPNTTLPRHNDWRASTFTTNGNPALTTLLTKSIQPNNKEPQLYKHIPNTTATFYSYYSPLWPCTHKQTYYPPLKTNQQSAHGRHKLSPGRKRTRCQTERQQHTPLTQILDIVALDSQIVIQPTEQPTNSHPNKSITRSQITSHNHHATQAFTQIITPPTQHINIINPINCQAHNNPAFEIADHPALTLQRIPQRKRRCEILDISYDLPSLNLTPLRTTHI